MRTPKVRSYVRVRLRSGRHSFLDPVWNRNRTLRSGYALVEGQAEHHPEGIYYLRFLRGRKRVWQAVGAEPDAALVALKNQEHDLQAVSLGRSTSQPIAPTEIPLPLAEAISSYLGEVRRFRSPKTIAACERILGVFGSRLPERSVTSLRREDLLDHMATLQDEGLSPRTIFNHVMRIKTFPRSRGIVDLLKPEDIPDYDEPEVEAYDVNQLGAVFAAADPGERLLFEFFLPTFRDQEVRYCTWRNVDFREESSASARTLNSDSARKIRRSAPYLSPTP